MYLFRFFKKKKTLVISHKKQQEIIGSMLFLPSCTIVMSSTFFPHLMFKFGDLIEFLCLRIDLIRICDYWIYWVRKFKMA